jgi:hypothetical protein
VEQMADDSKENEIIEVQGEALTPSDSFWLDMVRGTAKESISALEEAAKQLIAVTTLAQAIYFAAISFGGVKAALGTLTPAQQWLTAIALVVPLLFWLASLAFAVLVFKPKTYRTSLDSPDHAREAYDEIVTYKHRQLVLAHRMLIAAFVPLIINLVLYLILVPAKTG